MIITELGVFTVGQDGLTLIEIDQVDFLSDFSPSIESRSGQKFQKFFLVQILNTVCLKLGS
jgi:hypothetical protein